MNELPAEPISVLIVDDHAVVRKGVRAYLEGQPDMTIAGEAGSGEEAVELAAECKPDVILMDLVMDPSTGSGHGPATGSEQRMDGVEATQRVRQVSPGSQVVVLTSYHDDEYIFPVIRAGALSYLLKNVMPEESWPARSGQRHGAKPCSTPPWPRALCKRCGNPLPTTNPPPRGGQRSRWSSPSARANWKCWI